MTIAPSPIDLTTLAAVRSWAKVTTSSTADDDLLQALLTRISGAMLRQANRSTFYGRSVTTRLQSFGGTRLILPEFPVTSIGALSIGSAVIPAAPDPTSPAGYLLATWDGLPPGGAQAVDLYGYGFPRGQQGVGITYRTGYETLGEAAVIPASPYVVTPAPSFGQAMVDSGVTRAGVAMTRVTTGTPTTGQYKFTQDATTGFWSYTFAAADTGAAVALSYSWVPGDILQAATEWTVERYKYRDRVGERTRSLAGQQTASYDISGVPDFVREVLDQYMAVGPL